MPGLRQWLRMFSIAIKHFVLAPPVFGIGTDIPNSTTIRIPFYSTRSVTEEQYNVIDSKGRIYNDHKLMQLVDSNVTLTFHGYHRTIRGQAFVWNITESGVSNPTNISLSIWNDFGTSVYQFYWQPYSSEIIGEIYLLLIILYVDWRYSFAETNLCYYIC